MSEENLQAGGEVTTGSEPTFDTASALDTISGDLFPGSDVLEVDEGNTPALLDGNPTEKPATPEEPAQVAKSEAQPAAASEAPPKTWTKEAQEHWASIPPRVKEEILKREADMFKGLEQYKAAASLGNAIKAEVSPYLALLRSQQADPTKLIGSMLNAHYTLSTGDAAAKQALLRNMAKHFNVELAGLIEEPAYVDPQVAALKQELLELKSTFGNQTKAQQSAAMADIQQQVQAFVADPKNVYVNDVVTDMVALINAGVCKSLEDAYEKAVWQNPVTRAKEQSRLAAEAQARADQEAATKAEEARKATSANVKSRSRSGSGTAKTGSMDDTMMETLKAIKSRDK